MAWVTRNYARSLVALRFTSVLMNRIPGSFLMASELYKADPKASRRFMMRVLPTRFFSAENRRILNRILENGYFYHRWVMAENQVQANLPEVRGGAGGKILRGRSRRAILMQKLMTATMRGMTRAEQRNAVNAFKALVATGHSESDAVRIIEIATRRSQNPSTRLEESGFYTASKSSPMLGALFPLIGQPTVAANMVRKDFQRWMSARKDGKRPSKELRAMIASIIALAGSAMFAAMLREAVSRARRGKLWKAPWNDTDKAKTDTLWRVGENLASEALDPLAPGAANKGVRFLSSMARSMHRHQWQVMKSLGTMKYDLGRALDEIDETMMVRPARGGVFGGIDVLKGLSDDESYRVESGVMALLDAMGALGAPVGGALQAVQVGAGAVGRPLGQKPEREPVSYEDLSAPGGPEIPPP